MIPQPTKEPAQRSTRVAVQFDYQGKRVRTPAKAQLNPPLSAEPDDQNSAIKQAIIRWLEAK